MSRPVGSTTRRTDKAHSKADSAVVDLPPMGMIIGYKLRRAQLCVFQDFIQTFDTLPLRPAEFPYWR